MVDEETRKKTGTQRQIENHFHIKIIRNLRHGNYLNPRLSCTAPFHIEYDILHNNCETLSKSLNKQEN